MKSASQLSRHIDITNKVLCLSLGLSTRLSLPWLMEVNAWSPRWILEAWFDPGFEVIYAFTKA